MFLNGFILLDVAHTVEEVTCLHALLAAYLNGVELQPLVGTSHEQALALHTERAHSDAFCQCLAGLRSLENLQHLSLAALLLYLGPCARIRRQTADEVVHLLGWLAELMRQVSLKILGA